MLKSFKEIKEELDYQEAENSVCEILIEVPTILIDENQLALESIWQSYDSKWKYRIDAENPAIPLQRHIHIAKKNQTSSKNMQASWNKDGSIHDKHAQNRQIASQKIVQKIAREKLGVTATLALENWFIPSDGGYLLESNIGELSIEIISIKLV